jgi:hypothetical protein
MYASLLKAAKKTALSGLIFTGLRQPVASILKGKLNEFLSFY